MLIFDPSDNSPNNPLPYYEGYVDRQRLMKDGTFRGMFNYFGFVADECLSSAAFHISVLRFNALFRHEVDIAFRKFATCYPDKVNFRWDAARDEFSHVFASRMLEIPLAEANRVVSRYTDRQSINSGIRAKDNRAIAHEIEVDPRLYACVFLRGCRDIGIPIVEESDLDHLASAAWETDLSPSGYAYVTHHFGKVDLATWKWNESALSGYNPTNAPIRRPHELSEFFDDVDEFVKNARVNREKYGFIDYGNSRVPVSHVYKSRDKDDPNILDVSAYIPVKLVESGVVRRIVDTTSAVALESVDDTTKEAILNEEHKRVLKAEPWEKYQEMLTEKLPEMETPEPLR